MYKFILIYKFIYYSIKQYVSFFKFSERKFVIAALGRNRAK
jgi:hypothetical protein